ncbi:MAG TPA: primosomal protein N' [Candidatus Baltobacteraceae bacterium]|nr:primosomal protein N' [Candidatus Baltobacteraceae bacterium]
MTADHAFVDVVFPVGVEEPLTYRVPAEWRGAASPGTRVLAPLGSRIVTGYIVAERDSAPVAAVKPLAEVLDPEPLLDKHLLALTRWAAEYYLCPWGEVIRTALPPGIDALTRRTASLTSAGRAALTGPAPLRPAERDFLLLLADRESLSLPILRRRPEAVRTIPHLLRRGLIAIHAKTGPARVRPQLCELCQLADGISPDTVRLAARASKQRAILQTLAAAPDGLPRADAAQGNPAALAALIRRGLVTVRSVEVSRDPFRFPVEPVDAPRDLAPAQQEALAGIDDALAARTFQPLLLYGVTGSGKTEVYLQVIARALAQGRQALVLVPEIALTPLAVQRFLARFGGKVAVLHSGLQPGERYDAWRRIRQGGADIVVGARSAVFAPLPRLGIVVVDEEHDPSYKQEESPRYHGRDVAIMRAKLLEAPVVLGSATPSFESYERAQAGRYRLLRLPERIEARPLPEVEIVDLRHVPASDRLLSPPLAAAIAERLRTGEQTLLFLNRRGFSTLLLCEECGATLGCPHCSISLTYHAAHGRLRCHTCDFERRPPAQCPACNSTRMRYLGVGTQQIEAAVRQRFPAARVERLDRDSAGGWRAIEATLARLTAGEIDILVGTQMIGKGHDIPGVTLVGVIAADMALSLPDFRAGERAFAVFTQVVGRAGRGVRPGTAVIQTFNPTHYILQAVQRQDFETLWKAEAPLRQERGLPPFARAVLAIASSPVEQAAEGAATELAKRLTATGVPARALSGPAPAPLYRLRSRYRWHLLVHGQGSRLRARMDEAARQVRRSVFGRNARLDLDVDPASLC